MCIYMCVYVYLFLVLINVKFIYYVKVYLNIRNMLYIFYTYIYLHVYIERKQDWLNFKELAHAVMKASESQIFRVEQQAASRILGGV